MVRRNDLDSSVPLPPGLEIGAIRRAVEYIEREAAHSVDLYHEQANVFSAVAGMLGTRALDSVSNYEKHRHADTAQRRFPDLRRRGSGARPSPRESLENKASKRPWSIQSHYDHPGWYIVWRYLVDPAESLEDQRPVIIWRVDIVFLEKSNWSYEGSKAGSGGGGRTPYVRGQESRRRATWQGCLSAQGCRHP